MKARRLARGLRPDTAVESEEVVMILSPWECSRSAAIIGPFFGLLGGISVQTQKPSRAILIGMARS
jgi:hypothetical protein